MAHDPITAPTVDVAPHREPVFRRLEQLAAAAAKLVPGRFIMRALARHRATFQKWPNRPPQVTARDR